MDRAGLGNEEEGTAWTPKGPFFCHGKANSMFYAFVPLFYGKANKTRGPLGVLELLGLTQLKLWGLCVA